jgi:hypothetical protein
VREQERVANAFQNFWFGNPEGGVRRILTGRVE